MNANPGYLGEDAMALIMQVYDDLMDRKKIGMAHLLVIAVTRNSPRADHDALVLGWFSQGAAEDELASYCIKAFRAPANPEVFAAHVAGIALAIERVSQLAPMPTPRVLEPA